MQSLLAFYQSRVDDFNERLSHIKGRLFVSSMLRLVVFIGTVVAIYLFFGNTRAVLAIVIIGTALFLFLVSRHTDMQYERDKFKALVKINQIEIERKAIARTPQNTATHLRLEARLEKIKAEHDATNAIWRPSAGVVT